MTFSADFVNREALKRASVEDLRGIIIEGGPSALIDAAREELSHRCSRCGISMEPHDSGLCDSCEGEDAYEIASADVVLPLTRLEAVTIADALGFLAGVDEGEHTDRDALLRLEAFVRQFIPAETSGEVA